MKLLYRLLLNRFILSILILFMFAWDYNFVQFAPTRIYSLERPNETLVADSYYQIELGEAIIYVKVYYIGDKIHLVPTDDDQAGILPFDGNLIAWYYYVGAVVLVNIIPWAWFAKTKKDTSKKKK